MDAVKADGSHLGAEQTEPDRQLPLIVRGAQNSSFGIVLKEGACDEAQVVTLQSVGCVLNKGPLFG